METDHPFPADGPQSMARAALWVLFGAVALTIITDEIGLTTTPLFVDSISSRITDLTFVYALGRFPAAILSFIAGPIVDRFDRRRLLMTVDAIAGASLALAAFAAYRPDGPLDPLTVIYTVTFIVGGAGIVYRIAIEAFLPDLIRSDQLARANSVVLTTGEIATLVGPALAGLLAAGIGFWAGYASNTLGAVAALSVFGLMRSVVRVRPRRSPAGDGPSPPTPPSQITAGFARIFGDAVLRWTLITALVANVVGGVLLATLPVLARELMGISAVAGIGLVYSAAGLGGIIGGVAAGWVGNRVDSGKLLIAAIVILTAMLALLWAVQSPWTGSAAIATISGSGVIASIHIRTLRQQRSEPEVIGRVIAGFSALTIAATLVGALASGWLVSAIGSYRQMFGGLVVLTALAAVVLILSPLRELDEAQA